jgi:hypothetical protein
LIDALKSPILDAQAHAQILSVVEGFFFRNRHQDKYLDMYYNLCDLLAMRAPNEQILQDIYRTNYNGSVYPNTKKIIEDNRKIWQKIYHGRQKKL